MSSLLRYCLFWLVGGLVASVVTQNWLPLAAVVVVLVGLHVTLVWLSSL